MAKSDYPIKGTPQEVKTYSEVMDHYSIAKQDLEQRVMRKNGFDDADKMFSSYIDEANWPFKSLIFDPRPYTAILEKSARLIGSKPKGRLVPREGGDTLGAYINNELLNFQWDDNTRLGETMISKWIKMDQGTRKYGKKFMICKWRYETIVVNGKKKTFYDGPDAIVANSRDCLANPAYETVKQWFQHREYLTLNDLEKVNDSARTKPVYKNLDVLREAIKEELKGRGDSREAQYQIKNKSIRGLTDYLGRDEVFKTIEIVTEYRNNRWITFAPRHGVIIRDIENPYNHQQIPVVELCYYPLEDELYGMSELEPVVKQIRAINALNSQYIDNITVDLYPPLMVNPINVRMHTLEFAPEAKWLMTNPGVDVKRLETSTAATNNFQSAYSLLVGSLMNAWGEQSQGTSATNPFQDSGRVTATEIKDTSYTRNVRDNMNMIYLSDALKKQMMFWHSMNNQFLFQGTTEQKKVIRIVGREATEFFKRQGLSDIRPTEDDAMQIADGQLDPSMVPPGPRFPVVNDDGEETTKYQPDEMGEGGNLIVEPGDLMGEYDYVPDIEAMKAPSQQDIESKLMTMLATISNPAIIQMLQAEGKKPKVAEILERAFEATGVIKDASSLFEDVPLPQPMPGMPGQPDANTNPALAGGGQGPAAGVPDQGNGGIPGMEASLPPVPAGQNQPFMG